MPAHLTETSQENAQQAPRPDPLQHLMQIGTGYVLSSALWVAAELKIADLLREGPMPSAELARKTQTNEDALYRTLRVLAMVGIFAETEPGISH